MTGAFQVLEHTADVGLRLTGATLGDIFAAAGEGLATLEGSWFPGQGVEREVVVRGGDVAALLVAWLDELLYLRDVEDVVFGGFAVDEIEEIGEIDGGRLRARICLAPRGDRILDSAGVKAATYHSLRVGRANGGWVADVYLDV